MYRKWDIRGWKFFADFLNTPLDKDRYDKIRFWLDRMKLGESLVPIPHFYGDGDLPKVVELVLYEGGPDNENSRRNIKDVGYGASQIIPVIVAALTSADSALVLIEQPELHLHPEAQADIADLLIDSIKGTSRRLLVETHSETIFLRLRAELARTTAGIAKRFELLPQELAGYFVDRDISAGASSIGLLLFDSKGEFEAPLRFGDFFGQDFKEEMERDRAAAKIKE